MRSIYSVICCSLELLHLTNASMPIDEVTNKIKVRLDEEIRNGSQLH